MVEQNIPNLYETDGTSLEKKIIYQKWDLDIVNFYWLIAELDKKTDIAFGYANLNNDTFAEWGYIDLYELRQEGARQDSFWRPCTFDDAQKKIRQYRRGFHLR